MKGRIPIRIKYRGVTTLTKGNWNRTDGSLPVDKPPLEHTPLHQPPHNPKITETPTTLQRDIRNSRNCTSHHIPSKSSASLKWAATLLCLPTVNSSNGILNGTTLRVDDGIIKEPKFDTLEQYCVYVQMTDLQIGTQHYGIHTDAQNLASFSASDCIITTLVLMISVISYQVYMYFKTAGLQLFKPDPTVKHHGLTQTGPHHARSLSQPQHGSLPQRPHAQHGSLRKPATSAALKPGTAACVARKPTAATARKSVIAAALEPVIVTCAARKPAAATARKPAMAAAAHPCTATAAREATWDPRMAKDR